MPRPFKVRSIDQVPNVRVFKPAGIPSRQLTGTTLHLDEIEAIRLVDVVGLSHAQAAVKLKVSRPTVGRILQRVRKKIAVALVNGLALYIEDGDAPVTLNPEVRCRRRACSEENPTPSNR